MATKKEIETQKITAEIGESGTEIFSGIINEEYVPELAGATGVKKYDEMRRSDGTIKSVMAATQLPIRRSRWYIEPASEDEQDILIKEFVSNCLFDSMSITWDDFLRQSLLMLPFGVMLFEKVYKTEEMDGQLYIKLKKLAPRLPKSITAWEMDNGENGVHQLTDTGHSVDIPMEKLLVFVNDKEGDNWWGTSLLRAAYKHWYIKVNLEKIDSIAHERQSLGIPFVKVGANATAADTSKAKNILRNLRASGEGYLIEPQGLEVEFKDMKANTTRDPHKSIAYHNREILLSVLAEFLDLGSGESGSKALSTDQSELFLESLEAVANNIKDVINKYAIKELVDLNFNNVEKYPEINYSGISKVDAAALAESYKKLVEAGGIKATEKDEQHFRGVLKLPEVTEEDREKQEQEEVEKKEIEELENKEDVKKKDNSELAEKIRDRVVGYSLSEKIDYIEKKIGKIKALKSNKKIFNDMEKELWRYRAELKGLKFKETNDFKGFRKLTFAEEKVNFNSIQDKTDKLENDLKNNGSEILEKSKNDYLRRITPLVEKKDVSGINNLQIRFKKDYAELLKKTMKDAYGFGKGTVAQEMGIALSPNDPDMVKAMGIAADNIANRQAEQIVSDAKITLADKMARGDNTSKIVGAMEATMAKTIENSVRNTSSIIVSGHINMGRTTVQQKNASKIYALQRSEILDRKTCNFCLSIDERIVELTDPIAKISTFHSNCRGIWVEILQDEAEKPSITGVPQSIRDSAGDATNELTQPKNPIVKKNSSAANAIDSGKAGQ